ncbi:prepilin-type N-terminal cleavage/methylation domain-containing protein [Frigoriglobus tundricola]|uniref:Prepilin-type N-terminal cleavage/methylation domain-containing protein n=1 Tax=Frigoriglobus tundricola TaxID=2774151 RepID=A0A6M5YTQ6_9BACT|nr:prepilin-type N-terminal cleavage/methylation domain-containing protein [Frigoriglobus tundricola]QJW97477.1 hypothetical protein FTUN_5051 [Frigoriglobus tundricola]
MTRIEAQVRRGVTLVELLVVLALVTALAALALMIAPSIVNQDNTLKGTADVQAALKISQGMAAAARVPRGVRFLAPSSVPNISPSLVTELQYIECPPVMVPNPSPLTPNAPNAYVQFTYIANTGTSGGATTTRHCYINGLNADQMSEILPGSTLILPTLNWFSRISSFNPSPPYEAVLDVYPDAALGAGTSYQTYHFGIYGAPRPLLGEPTIPLANSICVDLSVSLPQGAAGTNYDIVFAPSGQRMASASVPGSTTQVFLWVRDYTKVANMVPSFPSTYSSLSLAPPNSWVFTQNQFLQGGEQQIVGIRGAAIGTAPVMWPDTGGTSYSGINNPFALAQQKLAGP